jgi:hypothetical protein
MRLVVKIIWVVGLGASGAAAEGIEWSWFQSFSGSATANVFDGGSVDSESVDFAGTNVPGYGASASDDTQPGSLGASAFGKSRGRLTVLEDDTLLIRVDTIAIYHPSFLPGGDNPGGFATAEMTSVIEFAMPVDVLDWTYRLDIDDVDFDLFTGSANVVIENVTRSRVLLELSENTLPTEATLDGAMGDIIRITSIMDASGSMGPGTGRIYRAELTLLFSVPEPSTLCLMLGCTAALLTKPRRRRHTSAGSLLMICSRRKRERRR